MPEYTDEQKLLRMIASIQPHKLGTFRDKDEIIIPSEGMRTKRVTNVDLTHTMDQQWKIREAIRIRNVYTDQYGFIILRRGPDHYMLFHHRKYVASTYTMEACKLISTVLLNDKLKSRSYAK